MTVLEDFRLAVAADPEIWIALPAGDADIEQAWLTQVAERIGADAGNEASQGALADAVETMRAGADDGFAFWFAPGGAATDAFCHVRLLTGLPDGFSTSDLLTGTASTVAPQVDPLSGAGLGVTGTLVRTLSQDWSGESVVTWIGVLPLDATTAVLVTAVSGDLHTMSDLMPHYSALVTRLELIGEDA